MNPNEKFIRTVLKNHLKKFFGIIIGKSRRVLHTRRTVLAGLPICHHISHHCHGGCINLYSQSVMPKPYRKWYHKSYYIIVWVLMEIVYSIFIGMISSKNARKIDGIILQCRRDSVVPNIVLMPRIIQYYYYQSDIFMPVNCV